MGVCVCDCPSQIGFWIQWSNFCIFSAFFTFLFGFLSSFLPPFCVHSGVSRSQWVSWYCSRSLAIWLRLKGKLKGFPVWESQYNSAALNICNWRREAWPIFWWIATLSQGGNTLFWGGRIDYHLLSPVISCLYFRRRSRSFWLCLLQAFSLWLFFFFLSVKWPSLTQASVLLAHWVLPRQNSLGIPSLWAFLIPAAVFQSLQDI